MKVAKMDTRLCERCATECYPDYIDALKATATQAQQERDAANDKIETLYVALRLGREAEQKLRTEKREQEAALREQMYARCDMLSDKRAELATELNRAKKEIEALKAEAQTDGPVYERGRSEGRADVSAQLRAILDPEDKEHLSIVGVLAKVELLKKENASLKAQLTLARNQAADDGLIVMEKLDDLQTELNEAWKATGVSETVRGTTSLADVVGTHRTDMLRAQVQVELYRKAVEDLRQGMQKLEDLTK